MHVFVDALWSAAGKELTSWLSFVMSDCDVVTFSFVSLVRCGAWLYKRDTNDSVKREPQFILLVVQHYFTAFQRRTNSQLWH